MAVYLKNKTLYDEMCRCQDASINISPELLDMFSIMIKKWGVQYTYKYPDDRKDVEQTAMIDLLMYWKGFDRTKSKNAFAYVTQIIKNGYQKGFRTLYGVGIKENTKISLTGLNLYSL